MRSILSSLRGVWADSDEPFLVGPGQRVSVSDVFDARGSDLSGIEPGDVICVIGDFDAISIRAFLELVDRGAIVVPLTKTTASQHEYFFEVVQPAGVFSDGKLTVLPRKTRTNATLDSFSLQEKPGLVLFTSGTTGPPKAILHDFSVFLDRYRTPRPALRTMAFLLFDHIGGLNTLFHTLFNRGLVVSPESREISNVLRTCAQNKVELLPTTPTFLRMLLMSDFPNNGLLESLKVITYGTERMDEDTLLRLCSLLPHVDFRQTYGMSELGILRVKSRSRDSLWMRVGGEGVETKIKQGVLFIRAENRMVGYLNAPNPFDELGWYNTRDRVEEEEGWIRIVGREGELANVGGLKFNLAEVENVALSFPGVELVKARVCENPYTGNHVELSVQEAKGFSVIPAELKKFLKDNLEPHKVPARVRIMSIKVSPRFKKT